MFKADHSKKVLELRYNLFEEATSSLQQAMLKMLMEIEGLSATARHSEAAGRIVGIIDLANLLEKSIEMFLTQEINDFFDTDAKLTYSLEVVREEKDGVHQWIREISRKTEQVQRKLQHQKDGQILSAIRELARKIGHDQRFSTFQNTIRVLLLDISLYQASQSTSKLSALYDDLHLHPLIKGASRKLFGNGHYSDAIFAAYKALINFVKDASNVHNSDGYNLMGQVFGFDYDHKNEKITRPPIIRLNELRTEADRGEQKGFMHIFQGAVLGVRNPKAHELVEQKDPHKALKYLALASLLAQRIDEAVQTKS